MPQNAQSANKNNYFGHEAFLTHHARHTLFISTPRYSSVMNSKNRQSDSITKPLLKDLIERSKTNTKFVEPSVSSNPLEPSDLYQDSGSGYNTDFTIPQE